MYSVFTFTKSVVATALACLWFSCALAAADSAWYVTQTVADFSLYQPGTTFTNTWTIRNTGTTIWNSGYSLVHDSGWNFCSHSTIPVSSNVAPNGTVNFTVSCQAPSTPGMYTETYRFVGPSGTINVLPYNTLTVVINVPLPAESARYIFQTVADNTTFSPGQSFTNAWTIRNTGTSTWGAGYYLQHVSGSYCGTGTVPVSGSVAPNATTALTVTCVAPTATGSHTHTYRLMGPSGQIGVEPYTYLTVKIQVSGGADAATWVSQTVPDNSVRTPGQFFANSWTIRNTGTTTWTSNYFLQHVSGELCSTGTVPVAGPVAPNATTSVSVPCVAPSTPGTYTHTYRLMGPSGQINITTYTYLTVVIRVEGGSESATWVSQTVPDNSVRTAGQSFTNTWTIRNTGTTTWGAGYYLQHVSGSFCGTGTLPMSGSVAPNATTTLTVNCTAPTATGTHTHTYRLMGPSGQINIATYTYLTVVIRVEAGSESATWVSQTVPDNSVRTAGQTFTNTWTIRNTGTTTWGAGYYLQHVSGSFCGTGTLPMSGSVAPNATTTLTVNCTAPTATGTHTHTYRLMGPSGQINIATYTYLTVVIRVEAGSESATWVSQTVPDNSVRTAGQSFTNTWTIRNTGTTTWGAGYYLQHVSGSFCGTGTVPVSGTVAPNATTTLTVNCTAPTATGTHTHTYRLMGPLGQINIATYTNLTVVIRVGAGSESATWVSQTVPDNSVRTAGQGFTNTWTIRNSGATTWGAGYYLQHVSGSFCGTGTVPVSGTVAPNATTTLTVSCTAPTTTGSHTHTYRLMGPSGQINIATYTYLTVVIRVEGGSESATWVSQTVPDNSVRTAGQNFTNTWTIRNTGTTTWGAGYYLQHVSGSYCGTGTVPISGTVAPNATTTITVNCTAPTVTGAHTHTYRLMGPSGQINIATYTYLTVVIRVGNASAPILSGISPAMPLATTQVQSVRVAGSGFLPGLTVQLFAQETLIAQLNGTAIKDLTPTAFAVSINFQGRSGTYDLRVTNPGDSVSSNRFRFVVNPVSTPQFILSESRIDFQMIEGACSTQSKTVMLSTSRENVRFSVSVDGAGGTEWLRVTPTSGQTPTTLQFSVMDGIPPKQYSATVRIRASGAFENTFSVPVTLRVVSAGGAISGIQMIDPLESEGSSLVDSDAKIIADYSALARYGRVVRGVAADGVARVVLRIPASREGERFTLSFRDPCEAQSGISNPDEDGTFLPVDVRPELTGTSSLTVTAQLADGRPMAFAVYRAPIDFVRASRQEDRSSRQREMEILIQSEDGTKAVFEVDIARPPVLLVHGLNSNADTWKHFCVREDFNVWYSTACTHLIAKEVTPYNFDFSSTGADVIANNGARLNGFQKTSLRRFRQSQNVSAAQWDIIAHSMGGLLVREIATYKSYKSRENFASGYIHKLITISTPHQGSRFADRILDSTWLCRQLAGFAGFGGGAINDLRVGGPALDFTNQEPIHSHLIAGVASLEQLVLNEGALVSLFFGKGCDLIPTGGFSAIHGQESDLIVSLESQLAMKSRFGLSVTSRFDGYIHAAVPLVMPIGPDVLGKNISGVKTFGVKTNIVSRVIQLLNGSANNRSLFGILGPGK